MSNEYSERDLVRQAIAGDRNSLSHLLLSHYDGLHRYIARRITPELQGLIRAEDVLHHTFVRVAQAIQTFEMRDSGSFRSWTRTIAANLIRDAEKRRRRERRAAPRGTTHASGDHSSWGAAVERIAGDSTGPTRRVQRRESIRRMQAALAVLAPDQREVLERYYLQHQSLDQIAEALGRTRDAVRGICYRARKNMRAIMGQSSLYFSG
jgi:RNA polymerase sigma-70 factor (ECF subfamily)